MKPVDANEMRSLTRGRRSGPLVWTRRFVFGSLFVLIVSVILLWVLRKPIAERALEAWCADRDLTCEAKFTTISADGVVLSGVRITSGRNVPAEAQDVTARISWAGLFSPQIEGISISGLEMRGTLDPAGLRFYGLERLAAPGTGQAGPAPPIDIRDARIFLDTPFGPAAATLNVSGQLPEAGSASLKLDPARLALGPSHIALSEALLSARMQDGEITGDVRLTADTAALNGFSARAMSLAAETVLPMSGEGPGVLEWSVRAARLAVPDAEMTGLRSRGQAGIEIEPGMDTGRLFEALTHAVLEAEYESAGAAGWTSGPARLDANLETRGNSLSGPLNLEASDVAGPQGRARSLRAAGDVRRTSDRRVAFEGGGQVVNAAVSPETLSPMRRALNLPDPLAAHGAAMSLAISAAAADFDAAFGLGLRLGSDGLVIRSDGPAGLASASGLRLEVQVPDDTAWLSHSSGETRLTGDVSLAGGGAPRLAADIGLARMDAAGFELLGASISVSPWAAGGNTMSAQITALDVSSRDAKIEAAGQGDVRFSGAFAGFGLEAARLSGGLRAVNDADGWRVQADGVPCLAFASSGIVLGALTVPQAGFDICPLDGRFIRQGGPTGGAARLGNVALPVVFDGGAGDLLLEGALADWTLQDGFALTLSAAEMAMPMTLGENTLTIDGARPEIRVRTGDGPVRLGAALEVVDFGGSLIPAKVTARQFSFEGASAPDGMAGDVTASGVRIMDPAESDHVYQPVMGDFTGRLDGRRLTATGPLRQEALGFALAAVAADLDIFDLTGTAAVRAEPIQFRPGGIQPAMISQRLVGLFTNATGSFGGGADFIIEKGDIQGTADLFFRDFGFQTTRLGRVDGVSGNVRFSDLMTLTTAPAQTVTIGSVDPGVAFADGRLVFSFEAGETLQIDEVTFPFAGGTLALAPLTWTLGGAPERVAVTATQLDLTQLIEVLKLPDTRAEGTVSGAFPLEFTPTSVVVRDARLRADAGGGRLSFTGAAMDAAAESDPVASLAFNALRDLDFSILEVGLSGDLAGQMRADMLVSGRNLRPVPVTDSMSMPPGQAFEFSIGFNLPLGQLISQGLQLADARTVLQVVTDLDTDGAQLPE